MNNGREAPVGSASIWPEPKSGVLVACASQETGDISEPSRQGSAEPEQKSIGLVGEQQPQELHDGDRVQDQLCDTKRNREQERE
jgi:hypothetical protein